MQSINAETRVVPTSKSTKCDVDLIYREFYFYLSVYGSIVRWRNCLCRAYWTSLGCPELLTTRSECGLYGQVHPLQPIPMKWSVEVSFLIQFFLSQNFAKKCKRACNLPNVVGIHGRSWILAKPSRCLQRKILLKACSNKNISARWKHYWEELILDCILRGNEYNQRRAVPERSGSRYHELCLGGGK